VKLIQISSCQACSFFNWAAISLSPEKDVNAFCLLSSKMFEFKHNVIPAFCPLPDAPDEMENHNHE